MNDFWSRNLGRYLLYVSLSLMLIFQAEPAESKIYIDIHSPLQKKLIIGIPQFRHEGGDLVGQPAGSELAETLGEALVFSGLFKILDPAVFLQDPKDMGVEQDEIKFTEWRFLSADLLVRGSYQIQGERLAFTALLFDVIQQKLLLKRTYTGNLADARQLILTFADEMMLILTGEPGIFQTQIAFVGDATGHKEIYLTDFDGTNIRRLTNDRSINLAPAWSGDGNNISYVSYKHDNPDLYVVNLLDRAIKRISMHPGLNISPAWHPKQGKLAATLSFTGNPELYLLDITGNILSQLTTSWAIDVSPSWSPDGQQLAYVSNRAGKPQIYVLDLASGRSRRLTFEGDYNTSPAWSPRGDRIAYTGMHDGHFNLFTIDPEGKEVRQLTGGEGNNENPCWAANGRLILFQSDREGATTLWVMLANGTDQKKLHVNLNGTKTEPAWSPRLTWAPP
jgi:TolB protein